MDDPARVGERIRAARERAGLSQRQLAYPGCSAAYISRVEAGQRIPSLQVLRELGARLGVSEDYLATGEENPARLLEEADLALRFDEPDRAAGLFHGIANAAADPQLRSQALEGLGQVALRRGEPREAVRIFGEVLDLAQEDAPERPALAESLARAHAALGELPAAITLLEKCVERYRDDPLQQVRFAALLGFALTDNGNFAEAERVVARALDRGRTLVDPYARARLFWSEFRLEAEEGRSAQAEDAARRALEVLREIEDEHALALLHQALAYICNDGERPGEALELLEEGRGLMMRTGTPLQIAQYRLEEARALAQLGEHERAVGVANEVTAALGEAHGVDLGRTYVLLAGIWESVGDPPRARELYELAVELLEQRPPTRYLVRAYKQLAGVLKEMGQRDEAFELLERAVGLQDRVGRQLT